MNKQRLLQIGLGSFGKNWFQNILPYSKEVEVCGVVTSNAEKGAWAQKIAGLSADQIFADYREAIRVLQPDLCLIVTPPETHREYAVYALEHGVRVLCEKPIAASEADAEAMRAVSEKTGIPLAIAENYRYFQILRRAQALVSAGKIGRLDSVRFDFRMHHEIENYHTKMRHPLLLDISVHHFDTIRFVTGLEAKSVDITTWDPAWSIYVSNSCATAELTMQSGVHVSYCASLCSYKSSTTWMGDWHIEGESGMIEIRGNTLTLTTAEGAVFEDFPESDNSILSMLDQIAADFAAGRTAENAIQNNLRSYRLAMRAIDSADRGTRVFL